MGVRAQPPVLHSQSHHISTSLVGFPTSPPSCSRFAAVNKCGNPSGRVARTVAASRSPADEPLIQTCSHIDRISRQASQHTSLFRHLLTCPSREADTDPWRSPTIMDTAMESTPSRLRRIHVAGQTATSPQASHQAQLDPRWPPHRDGSIITQRRTYGSGKHHTTCKDSTDTSSAGTKTWRPCIRHKTPTRTRDQTSCYLLIRAPGGPRLPAAQHTEVEHVTIHHQSSNACSGSLDVGSPNRRHKLRLRPRPVSMTRTVPVASRMYRSSRDCPSPTHGCNDTYVPSRAPVVQGIPRR